MEFQHKHYPKWAAEAGLPVPCTDCGFVPFFDLYMVWDELWASAGLDSREICCLECLERRLGRPLGIDDFPPGPINRLAYAAAGKLAVELEQERATRPKALNISPSPKKGA